MEVLNDMKMKGTEDFFILSSFNHPGLTDAIVSVYPQDVTQICFVHLVRNSLKHVPWKAQKLLAKGNYLGPIKFEITLLKHFSHGLENI